MKNDSDRNKPVRIVSQIEERIVNSVKKTVQYGEHSLSLETGKIARQAGGAVIASLGETSVMVTVVGKKSVQPGQGFFPLTVNYQERTCSRR